MTGKRFLLFVAIWTLFLFPWVAWTQEATTEKVSSCQAELGCVSGTLRIAGETLSGEMVVLRPWPPESGRFGTLDDPRWNQKTDEDGRFVFRDVRPGDYRISWMKQYVTRQKGGYSPGMTDSHKLGFLLKPGANLTVNLGGTGRPVVGKLVPGPEVDFQIAYQGGDMRQISSVFKSPTPPESLSEEARVKWKKDWHESEAGKEELRSITSVLVDIEDDGSFRADDVEPGEYDLHIDVGKWDSGLYGGPRGFVGLRFEVPDFEGEWTDEPLDLGEIPVHFREQSR